MKALSISLSKGLLVIVRVRDQLIGLAQSVILIGHCSAQEEIYSARRRSFDFVQLLASRGFLRLKRAHPSSGFFSRGGWSNCGNDVSRPYLLFHWRLPFIMPCPCTAQQQWVLRPLSKFVLILEYLTHRQVLSVASWSLGIWQNQSRQRHWWGTWHHLLRQALLQRRCNTSN